MGLMFSKPERLNEKNALQEFSCGVDMVDQWAHERSSEAQKRGTAVVYVSFCEGIPAGFYSLSAHSVRRNDVRSRWLKQNTPSEIPVILLGMLGVDRRFAGYGLGARLLRDAIIRALSAAKMIGCKALVVDPVDERAEKFYEHFGFKRMSETNRMYIPLK